MSLPENNILKLAENAKVMIFDHHLGKVIEKVYHRLRAKIFLNYKDLAVPHF